MTKFSIIFFLNLKWNEKNWKRNNVTDYCICLKMVRYIYIVPDVRKKIIIIVIWDLHRKTLCWTMPFQIYFFWLLYSKHIYFTLCNFLFLYQILTWHCNVYKMFSQLRRKKEIRKHFEERALNASYFFGLYDRNINYFYVCFKHEKDWLVICI